MTYLYPITRGKSFVLFPVYNQRADEIGKGRIIISFHLRTELRAVFYRKIMSDYLHR